MAVDKIPSVEFLEDRFVFITDTALRQNLAINFQYIIFLISSEEEKDLPGPVSYSIFKNIILYTASIVEGVLHYTLERMIKAGKIIEDEVMPISPEKWKWLDVKELYSIDKNTAVCGGKRIRDKEKLSRNTQFITIIRAAAKAEIIDETLKISIDNLRELRNRIHLAGLSHVDNEYGKRDIEAQFEIASVVLDIAEKKLTELA